MKEIKLKQVKVPETLNTRVIFNKKRMKIVKINVRFPKRTTQHYVVKFNDAVTAVVIDKNKNILLAKEWRSGWNKFVYKLPGGGVAGKGEAANRRAIKKELVEELGVHAKKITKLASVPHDVKVIHHISIYLAQDISLGKQVPEKDEYIEVVKMPFKKALKMFVRNNSKMTSESVLGLLLAKEKLKL